MVGSGGYPRVSTRLHSAYDWRSPELGAAAIRGAGMPKRPLSVGVGPRAMSCAGWGRASSDGDQWSEGDALTQGPNYAGGLAGSVSRGQ